MPRHLSLVAYNTPPTPASQDHSSCATAAPHTLRYIHSFARRESPSNGGASLVVRFMIERRFRHTSTRGSVAQGCTRGSVAPRRTSNRRFIGDCIHPSLLRRGATEPPDSHSPLYTFYMFYTAIPSAHSAPLRYIGALRGCRGSRRGESRFLDAGDFAWVELH